MEAKRCTDRRGCRTYEERIDGDINDEEGSKRGSPGDAGAGTGRIKSPSNTLSCCRSELSEAAVAHLPPAVRHDEGDGHRGPFVPVGWRLLAVPQNDDLGRRGERTH